MDKKKHLIACFVMVGLVIISAINICSTKAVNMAEKPANLSTHIPEFIFKNTDDFDYSFANEALPVNNSRVNRKMERSIRTHTFRYVQSNILQRKAGLLFPIIEPILRAYGIPDDFKYIPLVESGFGEGVSSKGAKGLWQFMPGTARTYGLKVGHGIDERRNIRKSTIAACRYIQSLYAEFNNWTLAAAAYNNGEIKLERAINDQNEDNYFRLRLNRETGVYIYNLIAMKAIISQPKKYGYKSDYITLNNNNPWKADLLAFN